MQNYSYYEQSHSKLSLGRTISVSVALNAMRRREVGLTAMLRSFASHDVSRGKNYIALHSRSSFSHSQAKFSVQAKQRRERFQIGPFDLSFSQRRRRIPRAWFILASGGPQAG